MNEFPCSKCVECGKDLGREYMNARGRMFCSNACRDRHEERGGKPLTSVQELNLILGECRRQAELLPFKQRRRLVAERADSMGVSAADEVRTAGLAIFQMSRLDKARKDLPVWATRRLRKAVEEARAFRMGLEVGMRMGGR